MKRKPIPIAQGTTYNYAATLGAEPYVYKSISAKVSDTPLAFTVTAHGAPTNWPVAILDTGFVELASDSDFDEPADEDDFYNATATDANTLTFNTIDATRLTGTYQAGGTVVYLAPVTLTSCSAVLKLYNPDGTVALSKSATLDNTAKTISATISAVDSSTLSEQDYPFALLFTDANGAITEEDKGVFTVYAPGFPPC